LHQQQHLLCSSTRFARLRERLATQPALLLLRRRLLLPSPSGLLLGGRWRPWRPLPVPQQEVAVWVFCCQRVLEGRRLRLGALRWVALLLLKAPMVLSSGGGLPRCPWPAHMFATCVAMRFGRVFARKRSALCLRLWGWRRTSAPAMLGPLQLSWLALRLPRPACARSAPCVWGALTSTPPSTARAASASSVPGP
jgi:hypothetical protein